MCKGYSIAFNSKDILTSDFDDLCVSHSILCYTEIAYVLIYNEIYDEQNWFNTHHFEDLLSKAKDQPHTPPFLYTSPCSAATAAGVPGKERPVCSLTAF